MLCILGAAIPAFFNESGMRMQFWRMKNRRSELTEGQSVVFGVDAEGDGGVSDIISANVTDIITQQR
jgi:uncharacterized membrane protein YhfC